MHVWPQDGHHDQHPRSRPTLEDYQDAANFAGVRLLDRPPTQGEMYIAGRNSGMKLLTAKEIHPRSWVVADDGRSYSYDLSECIAVTEI